MRNSDSILKQADYALIIFLFSLLTPAILFVFRHVDNNRLTSWSWAFAGRDPATFFISTVVVLVIAYLISRLRVSMKYAAPLLFVYSFLTTMIFWKEPEVIVDASRYFTQAKHLELYGIRYFMSMWGNEINAWTDLPLLPFTFGLIFKFFGETRIFIQVFITSLFSLTSVLIFLIGRTLWDEETGFTGGLLILGIPYLYTQVPLMLVDIATMFFITLAIYTFIKAIESGGFWIPFASVAITLAFLAKYSTWVMMSEFLIILLVYSVSALFRMAYFAPPARQYISRGIFTGIFGLLMIAIFLFLEMDVVEEQINILVTFQKPALKRWGESYISTFLYQVHPFITLSALYACLSAVRQKDTRFVIVCWLVMLMLYLGGWRIRYILPVFPMLALMSAYGLRKIPGDSIRNFIAFAAAGSSLILASFVYLPYLQGMSANNFVLAGQYLNNSESDSIEVITLPPQSFVINPAVSVPILDLFTDKQIHYNYIKPKPPKSILTSPLRFSWEFRNPGYYHENSASADSGNRPVVVIRSEEGERLPRAVTKRLSSYGKKIEFTHSSGFFRYSPSVIIYEP